MIKYKRSNTKINNKKIINYIIEEKGIKSYNSIEYIFSLLKK